MRAKHLLAVLGFLCCLMQVALGKTVPLRLSNPRNVTVAYPVTTCVPLPAGELKGPEGVALLDATGKAVPAQVTVQTRWWARDMSVQTLQVTFVADPRIAEYCLTYGESAPQAAPSHPVVVKRDGDRIVIENGVLRAVLDAKHLRLFEELWYDADGDGRFGADERTLTTGGIEAGEYSAEHRPPDSVEVEESGPVRAVIAFHGRHGKADGSSLLDYILRLHVAAGVPFVRMDYTFAQNDGQVFVDVPWIDARLGLSAGKRRVAFGMLDGAETAFDLAADDRMELVQCGPEQAMKPFTEGSEQDMAYPRKVLEAHRKWRTQAEDDLWERDVRRKTWDADWTLNGRNVKHADKAGSWVRVGPEGKSWSMTAGVRWLWQLHPKALAIEPDQLRLYVYPKLEKPLHLQAGLAKTHTLFLAFHSRSDPDVGAQYAAAVDAPPLCFPSPEWVCGSGVWGRLTPYRAGKFRLFEQDVAEKRITEAAIISPKRGGDVRYGMMNYGDMMYSYGQFLNLETAHDYGVFVEFLRAGDRKYFDIFERCVLHFRDVDTSHGELPPGQYDYGQWLIPGYMPERLAAEAARDESLRSRLFYYLGSQPLRKGGIRRHGFYHAQNSEIAVHDESDRLPERRGRFYSGTCAVSGHGWNIGTTAHYMITGDRYSLETAELTGDFILKHNRGSDWGRDNWKHVDLVHLYRATGKEAYRKEVLDAIGFFYARRSEVVPKTREQATALMSPWYTIGQFIRDYHQLSGDAEVGRKFVEMTRLWLDEVDKTSVQIHAGRIFGYIRDLKDSRCHGDFADLAYCSMLTGDRSYIDRGMDSLRLYLQHPIGAHSTAFFEIPVVLTELDRLNTDPLNGQVPWSKVEPGTSYIHKPDAQEIAINLLQDVGYRFKAKPVNGAVRLVNPKGEVVDERKITQCGLDAFTLRAPAAGAAGVYRLEVQVEGISYRATCSLPIQAEAPKQEPQEGRGR